MTKRKKLRTTDDVDVRYANWTAQLLSIAMPWSLYWIAGRASAKTVQVLATRVIEAAMDAQGAPFAWVADTYSDLHKNVIPSLIDGLQMQGWVMGVHYVINQEPPREWRDRMYNVCTDWKNTMVFYTGFNFTFISLDRPAIGAGRSYVGIFGDEVKYFPEEKLTNLLKAVRGFRVKYGNSVWYRSRTFTTDMPNPNHLGEYDWILKLFKQNDKERILLMLRCGFVYNEMKREHVAELQKLQRLKEEVRLDPTLANEVAAAERSVELSKKNLKRWDLRWQYVRKGTSFALISSSYVNADILGEDWFSDEFAEGLEGVTCNILSIIPKLEASQMFYCNLSLSNFYNDGNDNDVIEGHPFGWEPDCSALRYIDPTRPIEAGMDAGNMLSMVTGQRFGHVMRVFKELYTLPPNGVRELADRFLYVFAPHPHKILRLYYDRAMNNYKKVGQDLATLIKRCIENDAEGRRTGWQVQLMSLGQGIIPSNQEYRFMMDLLAGQLEKQLFRLLIDQYNCQNLKAEMEVTGTSIKTNERSGSSMVVKKKTGDKLPTARLPRESTNLTDALKYFIMRKEYVAVWQRGAAVSGASMV